MGGFAAIRQTDLMVQRRPADEDTSRPVDLRDGEGRVRVVLVDDSANIRVLVRTHLELDGRFAVVGEAADGRAAVQLARDLRPDAVVLDLAMPVMDGLHALPLIRDAAPPTKIVVLSGFDEGHMVDEA